MNARNMACIGAAALVGTLLVTATAALAQPGQHPVVIEKQLDTLTRYVSYADLSLASKEGQRVLYRRVGDAVQAVCPELDELGFHYDVQDCEHFAWSGARPQIGRAIRAAKAGMPDVAMTIAITAAHN